MWLRRIEQHYVEAGKSDLLFLSHKGVDVYYTIKGPLKDDVLLRSYQYGLKPPGGFLPHAQMIDVRVLPNSEGQNESDDRKRHEELIRSAIDEHLITKNKVDESINALQLWKKLTRNFDPDLQ
jgi:hypothetical protein